MRYSNYMFHVPDEKICRVIIDTDAANEGDDQFAAVHAMLSPRFDNVGFIAAHYGAENSMERSYDELLRLFSALECPFSGIIKKGAPHPLLSKSGPVVSEGSALIVEEAMKDRASYGSCVCVPSGTAYCRALYSNLDWWWNISIWQC